MGCRPYTRYRIKPIPVFTQDTRSSAAPAPSHHGHTDTNPSSSYPAGRVGPYSTPGYVGYSVLSLKIIFFKV